MAAATPYLAGVLGGLNEIKHGGRPALCLGTVGAGDGFPPGAGSCCPELRHRTAEDRGKSYPSLCPQYLAQCPACPRVSSKPVLKRTKFENKSEGHGKGRVCQVLPVTLEGQGPESPPPAQDQLPYARPGLSRCLAELSLPLVLRACTPVCC